jgi:sugar phosphate isomerase/epimerase
MRLALSSAAAPDATFDELLDACARRGFAAVELEAGHAHGVSPSAGLEAASAVAERAARAGIGIAALRLDDVASVLDPRTPRLAVALGAPVVVRVDVGATARSGAGAADDGGEPAGLEGDVVSIVREATPLFAEVGATLLLACSGDVDEVERLRMWVEAAPAGTLGLAWDVTPGDPRLAVPAAVLEAAAGHIRHIRLHGGGPETMGQEGLGVGRLMSALALSGYTGALALAPSNPRFRYAWGAWLGRRGGWGCGSKAGSDTVVISSRVEKR